MASTKCSVNLKIRRFDISDHPDVIDKNIKLNPYAEYATLKKDIQDMCEICPNTKVIKFRNEYEALVPLSFLFDAKDQFFYLDVTNISYNDKNGTSLLQDAYVDAVHHKLQSMESRIAQAELLLPQLQWRRQAHMEETVNALATKVAFLNRRFDELKPQCRSKLPETMA